MGLCALQPAARADSARETARSEWERGTIEYTLGHFEAAAQLYEDAYRLLQDPALLFDVGQARRRAGAAEAALTAYKSFLKRSRPDATVRDVAERRIQELEASLAARTAPAGRLPVNLTPSRLEASTSPVLLSPPPAEEEHRRSPWWLWGAAGAVLVSAGIAAIVVLASPRQEVIPGKDGTVVIR